MPKRVGTSPQMIDFCLDNKDKVEYDIKSGTITTVKGTHGCLYSKRTGYLGFKLAGKCIQIHTFLCAIRFGHDMDWMTVNHINGKKQDNRSSNLEVVPLEENVKKEWETGLCKGHTPLNRKLVSHEIKEIRDSYIPYDHDFGASALSRKFKVHPSTIQAVLQRETYQNIS